MLTKHKHIRKKKKLKKCLRSKWTGFIRWRTGLIHRRTDLIRRRTGLIRLRIEPVRRQIKPVHLVLIFSLNWPLVFLICQFLLVFSCPKRDNNTIMMSIICLFFQDRHSEIVKYPFKRGVSSRLDPSIISHLQYMGFCIQLMKRQLLCLVN